MVKESAKRLLFKFFAFHYGHGGRHKLAFCFVFLPSESPIQGFRVVVLLVIVVGDKIIQAIAGVILPPAILKLTIFAPRFVSAFQVQLTAARSEGVSFIFQIWLGFGFDFGDQF